MAADTLTGGSYGGVCSWYDPDLDWFWGDWWKMMQWAKSQGLSTNWEFNNSFAKTPLDQVYGDERAHIRHSLAMALSYGADVILIYEENTDQVAVLNWASRYVGKDIDAALSQPVWIMLREAIEDNNEEHPSKAIDHQKISDPEDSFGGGDGFSCEPYKDVEHCACGHDVETSFGIASDSVNGPGNTSFGSVKVIPDGTEYGATARRAATDRIYFDVNDAYMTSVTQVAILVRYLKVGADPQLRYWRKNPVGEVTLTANSILQKIGNWYEATFIVDQPDFAAPGRYDFAVDSSSGGLDWIDYIEVAPQNSPPTATPPPTPTPTPTPTPEPTPSFRERMETAPPGGFSPWYVANGASLSRVNDPHTEGSYAWKCLEGSQLQNWPECSATYNFQAAKDHLVLGYAVYIKAATQVGPVLWSAGGYLWPYFDLSNQLHIYCSAAMCGQLIDIIPGHNLQANSWYRLRVEVRRNITGSDSILVTAYAGNDVSEPGALWTYENGDLNLLSSFSSVQMFTRFGVNNGWDELAYWDDFQVWYGQMPTVLRAPKPFPDGWYPGMKRLQIGVDGYYAGQDTYIATSNWETPTPHGSHPNLYVRTNSTDGEVMSALIGFDEVGLPLPNVVYEATLSVYFLGQSVSSGETKVHAAGLLPDWEASTATWLRPKTGANWQAAGAKGANDRTAPMDSLLVSYTEVGTWLEFDVTELVQAGTTSFILYGEHQGVNKAIYFPSNDYWDASKRPVLTIRHD